MALSPIDKAIADVKFSIPLQILKKVFIQKHSLWTPQNTSLEDQIKTLVLPKVLSDCDIVGGTKVYIATSQLAREYVDQFTIIFRIPKSLTQGRSITGVLGMGYLESSSFGNYNITNTMESCSFTAVTENALALLSANDTVPMASTAEVSLIAENTVMVKDTMYIKPNGYLWCELSNATNMANIQIRSIHYFSQLVTHAVKAYIYNQYIIQLDTGELAAGQELGAFRNIIEGYSDSMNEYNDFLLNKWEAVAFMNDTRQYTDFIKMQIPGRT